MDPVVVIAGTVVVTACLVSMVPRPRVLPLLAPLTLVLTALLWLPGGQALWHAFENFWLAAALTCCSLLLAARALLRGADSLGGLVAVLAATVGTTLNWLPMLAMCWIGPVVVSCVWWRSHAGNLLHRLAGVLVCAAALLVALRTILGLYHTTPVSTLVRATGGIEASAPGPLVLVLVLFVVLSIVLGDGTGRLRDPACRRLRWVGLGILSGVAVTAAFTVAQRSSIGTVDYYAIKLTLGVLLVAACWVAATLALVLDRLLVASGAGPRRAWAQVAAVALACVACTQVLGHMSLARAGREVRGLTDRDFAGQKLDYHAMAQGIVVAASSADRDDALRAAYVALGSARCYVARPAERLVPLLTGTFTVRTSAQTHVLDTGLHPVAGAVAPVRGPLREQPSLTVVVDPDHARALREQLDPGLADRVHTWTTSPRAVTDRGLAR